MPDQPHDPAATPAHLPALLPPAATLLRRTQTTLGLLRDVVQESSAKYWYERGKAASAAEDWEEAVYALEQCIKLKPTHWRGALQLVSVLASQQHSLSLALLLKQAYTSYYTSWQGFIEELNKEQWGKLQIALENSVDKNNTSFDLSLAIALTCRVNGFIDKGFNIMNNLNIFHKSQAEQSEYYYRLLGSLWYDKHTLSLVLERWLDKHALSKALENLNHAVRLAKEDNLISRIECLSIKWEIELESRMIYIGFWHLDKDDIDEMTSEYDKISEINPEISMLYHRRGNLFLSVRYFGSAIKDYNRTIELDPFDAFTFIQRGDAKSVLEKHEESMADFGNGIDLSPINPRYYYTRGIVKKSIKDYIGALEDFKTAIKLEPNDSAIRDDINYEIQSLKNNLNK